MALAHANTVLSWLENLPRREHPPQWMWVFPGVKPSPTDEYPPLFMDPLAEWWEEVDAKRDARNRGDQADDDDDEGGMLVNRNVRMRR